MAFFLAPLLAAGAGAGTAAALTAAATVAGAAINAKSVRETNAQNKELADPVYARQRLEAAGFNPSVKYGGYQAATMQPNQVGSILSQGIAAASDQLQVDGAQKSMISKLEDQNDHLTRELHKQKLNPHVGGIYAGSRVKNDKTGGPSIGSVHTGLPSDNGAYPAHVDDLAPPEREKFNLYIDVFNPETERWVSIPNPDLMDAGPLEVATGMAMIGAADIAQNAFGSGGPGSVPDLADTRPKRRPSKYKKKHPSPTRKRVINPLYSQN